MTAPGTIATPSPGTGAAAATRLAILGVGLSVALAMAGCWDASVRGVGLHRLSIADAEGTPIDAMLFYPSTEAIKTTVIGPYDVRGTWNSEPMEGSFPLVVVSHGTGGSLLGHHDTASHLAAHGFVVATLTHPGDNFEDTSGLGKASTAFRRARQVSRLIDVLVDDPRHRIDPDRIGVVGYSAGAATALLLAGAQPDFGNLRNYCRNRSREGVCESGGIVEEDWTSENPVRDRRVRAALLLAPVGALFPREGLDEVTVPVAIVAAQADELLASAASLNDLVQGLRHLVIVDIIPRAGHFVFLAPCAPRMAAAAPAICTDSPAVDRTTEHALMNGLAASFFYDALTAEDGNEAQSGR